MSAAVGTPIFHVGACFFARGRLRAPVPSAGVRVFSISVRVKFREGLVARPGAVSDSSSIIFYVGACVFVSCTWVRVFLVARGSRFGAVCGAACYLFRVGACVFACGCVFNFRGEGSREIRRPLCVVRPDTSTCPLNQCLRQCVFLQGQ